MEIGQPVSQNILQKKGEKNIQQQGYAGSHSPNYSIAGYGLCVNSGVDVARVRNE